MKKIFITAIGGDIGYGIIKAIKNSQNDFYIIGCDINEYNYSKDVVDEFIVSPSYHDEEKWTEFVLDILNRENVEYFWPVTEPELKIVSKNKDIFSGCTVVMNTPDLLEIAMDKGQTAAKLKEAGVDTPNTWWTVEDCEQKYPLIVKEKFGCGSHGVKLVREYNELVEAFNTMENPVIQEYIGSTDEEYTMSVFSDGEVVNAIAFKRELGFGGMSRYVELVHDNAIDNIGLKIAEFFNLHGSINVQMRKENDKYYVFEINPRISSTIGFRQQLGFNDVSWWIDMLEGRKVEKYTVTDKKVHGVRNVEEKLFFD